MQQFFSLLSWRLFTAQHVSGVFPPIIRSSMTAVAVSGFTRVWFTRFYKAQESSAVADDSCAGGHLVPVIQQSSRMQYLHCIKFPLTSAILHANIFVGYLMLRHFMFLPSSRAICGCSLKTTWRTHMLTLRRLMSYIYGAPILDVSRSHTTTQHSR